MPTLQRTPNPTVAASPTAGVVAVHGSPGVLLPPGDPWAAAGLLVAGASGGAAHPAGLEAISVSLEALRDRPSRHPARWSAPAFAREVERVRSQLRPVRSRESLVASFAREASFSGGGPEAEAAGAVATGYALRWLELGDGEARPGWRAWLARD
jgi:hypothetical protein